MTCIIVEDEPLAQLRLKDFIMKTRLLQLKGIFDSGEQALQFLESQVIDVIFLDIHMDGISGMQLMEQNKLESKVIITTAYDEFAVKGFDLNVTDYLLKPYTFERFSQAVSKAKDGLIAAKKNSKDSCFFVRIENRQEKIKYSDLLYIEGMRDYRKIYTLHSKPLMTLQTFREFESQVPAKILCRVHKSFMVAVDKIDAVSKNDLRIGDKIIPVSDTYRDTFFLILSGDK